MFQLASGWYVQLQNSWNDNTLALLSKWRQKERDGLYGDWLPQWGDSCGSIGEDATRNGRKSGGVAEEVKRSHDKIVKT